MERNRSVYNSILLPSFFKYRNVFLIYLQIKILESGCVPLKLFEKKLIIGLKVIVKTYYQ